MSDLRRHVTRHGTSASGDSLDLYGEETALLVEMLSHWDETRLEEAPEEGSSAAPEKWDNGTLGKLVIEHSAVWLAARRDIARVLSVAGRHDLELQLTEPSRTMADSLGRLEKQARGINPVTLAGDPSFVDTLMELRTYIQPALLNPALAASALGQAVGDHRRELHTARYIRKHAPVHPGGGWSDKVPFLLRLRTAYDRSRGFPWAESAPLASKPVAEHYDREGP